MYKLHLFNPIIYHNISCEGGTFYGLHPIQRNFGPVREDTDPKFRCDLWPVSLMCISIHGKQLTVLSELSFSEEQGLVSCRCSDFSYQWYSSIDRNLAWYLYWNPSSFWINTSWLWHSANCMKEWCEAYSFCMDKVLTQWTFGMLSECWPKTG